MESMDFLWNPNLWIFPWIPWNLWIPWFLPDDPDSKWNLKLNLKLGFVHK